MTDFCPSNGSVLDLFGGTGTTMIAAEKTDRKCFMMELSPTYCDVIIARWEKFTDKKAKRVGDREKPKTIVRKKSKPQRSQELARSV